ncbi:hypothetical protein [Chitinophaga nivalis]|uniref:Uncharacterized protein n=1 Tax=Chitinophaga nivalis TaxID=2991709 RepID=A0ABT3IIT5_9BACT|nr:hypothetical protein [Chitinophaga nivalis]MCW3466434.1 hypothetical protein [Chitinophaga nivalis]MCW3483875.1 hypothetical protein [Chitinophaga nivalis]
MNFKKNIQHAPLAILIIALGYSIYTISTTNITLGNKHYWGVFWVLASIVATVFNAKIGKIVTFITLFLGAFNLIAFTPVIEFYSFGFSLNKVGLDLKVQPFSLWTFLLFIIINIRPITRGLKSTFSD